LDLEFYFCVIKLSGKFTSARIGTTPASLQGEPGGVLLTAVRSPPPFNEPTRAVLSVIVNNTFVSATGMETI